MSPLACGHFGYCRLVDREKPYDGRRDAHWTYFDALEAIRARKIANGEIKP
jgi:hypothetical protein